MYTKNQIEAAKETLRTPFANPELEALRKLVLYATDVPPTPLPKKPRKARKPRRSWGEIEDIILSDEPPSTLVEQHGYAPATLRAMKKGDPGYDQYGGGKEFWVSYHSRYRDEFNGLLRSRRRSRRARTNDNNSKK